jgi:hypothetical protein
MNYDTRAHAIRFNAESDQALCTCREYYESLTKNKRTSFRKLLRCVSTSLRRVEESACELDKRVDLELSITYRDESVSIDPMILLEAIKAWEKGEAYTELIVPQD